MRKILLLLTSTISLMSSLVFAIVSPTPHPYSLLPQYTCKENIISLVPNMPRIRSQDSTRACVGFSAWTIAQHRICKIDRYSNCSSLTPEQEISPISVMSFAYADTKDNIANKYDDFKNLQLGLHGPENAKYISVTQTLRNFREFGSYRVASESCYPFDQIANSFGISNTLDVDRILSEMNESFKKLKASTEADVTCAACEEHYKHIKGIEKLKLKFDLARNTTGIKNFEQLLYQLTIGNKCDDEDNPNAISLPSFLVSYYPKTTLSSDDTVENFIKVIEEQTKAGNPVAISPFCVDRNKDNNSCLGYHASVISGVKNVCTCSQPVSCKKMFKLHNSLGESWQKATNNGGWVDAEILLSNLPDRKAPGILTWTPN